jgi:transposase-like protein
VCPHCGSAEKPYQLQGKAHRPGLWKRRVDCRKQFTVTVGAPFERSKVSLPKWLMAAYLLSSSRKGISTRQLHKTLGVTYKTAPPPLSMSRVSAC